MSESIEDQQHIMVVEDGIAAKIASRSKWGMNRTWQPAYKDVFMATNSPCVWKTGSAWINVSPSVIRKHSINHWVFESRF